MRLAEHEIAGLGFGTGFAHKRLPSALVDEARKRDFPLFEVPYELPFIAITERVFAQLLDERYEMLQRSMAGDVLAEALTGRLYPEELRRGCGPSGSASTRRCWRSRCPTRRVAAPLVERILARARVHSLVAIRAGLLCAVIDAGRRSSADSRSSSRGASAPSSARAGRGARGRQPRRPRRSRCA